MSNLQDKMAALKAGDYDAVFEGTPYMMLGHASAYCVENAARVIVLEEQVRVLREALEEVPASFIGAFLESRAWTSAKDINIQSRKDAVERWLEGDWLKRFMPKVSAALAATDMGE